MATPTPLDELESATDAELLPPARPRFASRLVATGLPSRRARLGGGTSVSNSAKAISAGVWKEGSRHSSSSARRSSVGPSFSRRCQRDTLSRSQPSVTQDCVCSALPFGHAYGCVAPMHDQSERDDGGRAAATARSPQEKSTMVACSCRSGTRTAPVGLPIVRFNLLLVE